MKNYRIKPTLMSFLDGDKVLSYKLQKRFLFFFWWTIDESPDKSEIIQKRDGLTNTI